jgi:hypothetical protein
MVSVLAMGPLGCPRSEPSVNPEPLAETDQVTPPRDPAAPSGLCGSAAQRFTDYDWIPDDSRLTTAILRDDPELPAALSTVARMAESDAVQLPIRAALDFRNLGWQLRGLEGVMTTVELDPGELVALHGPTGDVVWLWPTDCPTVTLATRMLDRFSVLVRIDFEHPGVRLGVGSDSFPFDLVLLHERLVALAPRGRGAHVSAWLSKPRIDASGPGVALASIELAPIRSVLNGPALLGDPDGDAPPGSDRHRKLRATADAWYDGDRETTPEP